MLVGIHPDMKHGGLGHDSQALLDILKYNDIKTALIYAGSSSFWDEVAKCDLFIFQWTHHDYYRQIARSILPVIENHLRIRCFPNLQSSWLYDDKIRQYYVLKAHGFPIIESWVFYDRTNALTFLREAAHYPLVFKLRSGAGSRMIRLLENEACARRYVTRMFRDGVSYKKGLPGELWDQLRQKGVLATMRKKLGGLKHRILENVPHYDEDWFTHKNYVLVQRFLPNNAHDTRVVIIGNHAFAFVRYNRPEDFRASGSNRCEFDPKTIDLKFVEMAFQVSKRFRFDSMAYDFLYDQRGRPAIAEMSYVFGSITGSKVVYCPGYWDDKMAWHEKRTEVPYCILSHLLNKADLKNPRTHPLK